MNPRLFFGLTLMLGVLFVLPTFVFNNAAEAAIAVNGPPMDGLYFNATAGPGAIIPAVRFMLQQNDGGIDTLTKVGFYIRASSTMSQGEISRVSLWQESGTSPNFQVDQDTFISGAASTTPIVVVDGSAFIVLTPTAPVSIGATPTEFYIVATTTSTIGNITNGDAFDITMDANWASTTPGGIGSAFIPQRKVILEQTIPVLISEVRFGVTGNSDDEFIELYNPNSYSIDLQRAGLKLYIFNPTGGAQNKTLSYLKTVIQDYGYFLIGSPTNYSGSIPLDATYSTLDGTNNLVGSGGFSIATSSTLANATSSKVDLLGWDAQPAANCAAGICFGNTFIADKSLERKALTDSTAVTMASGGADATKGNGFNTPGNGADFVVQTIANPQNSSSAKEFSSGGGNIDIVGPRVMGSYPNNGMPDVSRDQPYVGFGFDEGLQSGTIASVSATTTVTLVPSGTAPAGVAAANLCASVTYNPMAGGPGSFEPPAKCILASGSLSPNTSYIFEVGTSTAASQIRDMTGNVLDQNGFQDGNQSYQATFTTGGANQTMTNITPPHIIGTTPFGGSNNIPSNITKITVRFSQNMDSSTLSSNNIFLYSVVSGSRTAVSLASATFGWDATSTTLTITGFPALSANTQYEMEIDGMDSQSDTTGVKSSNNILLPMPFFTSPFWTGSADASAPIVLGSMPVQGGATNVALNKISYIISFDDHIDASTATSGSVTLGISGGDNLPGTVAYDPFGKELSFTASNVLPAGQTLVLTLVGASVKNISGVKLGSNYTLTFDTEANNSDVAVPSIFFVNADEFGIAITFNEAVNGDDARSLTNYAVTQNSVAVSLSSMAGHTVSYDASKRTARLGGMRLTSGTTLQVTASNIRDISGNTMTSSSASCPVQSMAQSGGFIDPGMSSNMGMVGPPPDQSFTMGGGGGGFMPGANVMTMNNFVSATSTYGFEVPISQQIVANGTIIITFPQNSDYNVLNAATSSVNMVMLNEQNKDINGYGAGTVGVKTITNDNTAKTVTLTLDTATRSENSDTHDFLRFGITNIVNPSIPKGPDSTGYLLDIKTKNSSGVVLESGFSLNPVFIGGGNFGGMATTTIRGQILGSNGNYGLNNITVMLHSPILGPMPRMETASSSIWGSGHGEFQFTNLPINNDYFIFMAPDIAPTNAGGAATTTTYFGLTDGASIRATSTSVITNNITLTPTTASVSLNIKLISAINTFTATEQIDVFAGGPGKFIVKTVTPGTAARDGSTVLVALKIPQNNGMWNIGIGPAMPKDGMMMGPPPATTWINPKPINLDMSGCTNSCQLSEAGLPVTSYTFSVSRADKTIQGIVRDASGTTISNAMVFAYSTTQMMGNHGQSDTAGKFSIAVTTGSYNVGAFFPGMGQSREVSVEVTATGNYVGGSQTISTGQTGANPFILSIKKPAYTITGRVTDGTNAISNAPVFTYQTNGSGHADAMTDTSGNYTLYVDNGAWVVNANIPGYGQMAAQSVTVSGANKSNVNFSPSSAATYWSVMGTVFESDDANIDATEGVSSVMVMAKRLDTGAIFETKTGTDGKYTLRLPELATTTSQYRLDVFKPGYGKIPLMNESLVAIPAFGIVATTTWNVRINSRQTVTINIKDGSDNFVTVPKAFIDLFDVTANYGNHVEIRNGTSTTVQIPNGASTTIRAFIPGVPPSSVSIASDNAGTLVLSNILEVNGSETIKIVINTNFRTISGNVYHTVSTSGNELKDVWVEVIDSANGMHYGVSATSTSGEYSIKLADGTYKIVAVKPGYMMTPQSLTVSANAYQSLVMASASLTISGTITAGGSAADNAFVRAEKIGGGFAVTQAGASGIYSLSVDSGTWRIFAASPKYSEAAYSGNPLSVSSSQTGINIALATPNTNIQDTLATSNTFKDTASGSFEDTTVNVKVTVDSGALGQAGNDSYLTAQETANYPTTPSVNIIGDEAKDINAYSGGSQVKNMESGKKAEVEMTYAIADLTGEGIDTPSEVNNLKVAAWSDTLQEWETLATVPSYKDTNGSPVTVAAGATVIPGTVTQITFKTTEATHFSNYALVDPTDPGAPDTPSGITATVGAAGTNQITISWSNVTAATGYYLYRNTSESGSFPLLGDVGNVTSYTNTGLTVNTTYYYQVAAYKSGGTSESAASSVVSATPQAIEGGGIISGGGGGSAPTVPPQVPTPTPTTTPTITPTVPTQIAQAPITTTVPSVITVSVSPVFVKALKVGITGTDVKRLQQLLNSDPDTQIAKSGVGSSGNETEYFGSLTMKALQKFQAKYGIVSSGSPETTGYGLLGPKTRAKLAEVFDKTTTPTAPETAKSSQVAQIVSPVFNTALKYGITSDEVKQLQELLASDPEIYPEGIISGWFGQLTRKAVERFQCKYDIVCSGDESTTGYGLLGPKTRAKLQEVFK